MINYIKSIFSSPKFRISRSPKNGQYYFVLVARNGETILSSEGYVSEQGAVNGIHSVTENATSRFNFSILDSEDNKFYFVLKAKNGEIIGTSETYNRRSGSEDGIRSVMRSAITKVIKFMY